MTTKRRTGDSGAADVHLQRFVHRWARAILTNDVGRMEPFTTEDWILIDRPGVIPRAAFHDVVASGDLAHEDMTHEVLGIDRYGPVAVVRTRGRNSAVFRGERVLADEWTTNLLIEGADGWRCFLTQLTPRQPAGPEPARSPELVPVDDDVLERLVAVATTDAAPDDVTPPLGEGWTSERVEWLRAFHTLRRTGLAGGDEETAAVLVDARVVGATRLQRASAAAPDELECGIWLARSARGLGLGSAVLGLLRARAAELGAARLVARTTSDNAAVMALLRRAGAVVAEAGQGAVRAEIQLHAEDT